MSVIIDTCCPWMLIKYGSPTFAGVKQPIRGDNYPDTGGFSVAFKKRQFILNCSLNETYTSCMMPGLKIAISPRPRHGGALS
jgi:hypothetical protein